MNTILFIAISLAEIFSLILIIKLWRSNEHKAFKIIGTLIGLIPLLGLFLLLFIFSPQPQPGHLQNRGPRGAYTHSWLWEREFWKYRIEEKEAKIKDQEDNA